MKMLLATAAALAIAAFSAGTASADTRSSHGVRIHSGSDFDRGRDRFGDFDRRDRRRHRGDTDVILSHWGGEWALYNNRSFESDSYNDWWHDRPDRAYPRWLSNGGSDRIWWSGGGWRGGR